MHLQGLLGIVVILLAAWLLSENRWNVNWRLIGTAFGLQLGIAVALLKLPASRGIFLVLNRGIFSLEESTRAGTAFVFGYLGGGEAPFKVTAESATYILAFRALPLIVFISALSAVLFYWKVLPLVVRGFSTLLQRTTGIGGAEGLGVAANIFLGMVESPLAIRPYLAQMNRSELFTVMTSGMATIAGTVMVLYASLLTRVLPGGIGHILAASIINAPAAIVISKLLVPATGPVTAGELSDPEPAHNTMDALTRGTLRGVQLYLNVVAMLVVLVALVYLVNLMLGLIPWTGEESLTLQGILGFLLAPFTWLMGISWADAPTAARLLGTKTILNELVAYLDLGNLGPNAMSPRSVLIMTYAMCGFANPGSVGIMIGGMGTMVPDRRSEIVDLGLKSLLAGTLATCLTGTLVGILI